MTKNTGSESTIQDDLDIPGATVITVAASIARTFGYKPGIKVRVSPKAQTTDGSPHIEVSLPGSSIYHRYGQYGGFMLFPEQTAKRHVVKWLLDPYKDHCNKLVLAFRKSQDEIEELLKTKPKENLATSKAM